MDTVNIDRGNTDSNPELLPQEEEESTRGYELYLRHILLLLQAAPFALKGVIHRKVTERNGILAELISEKKDTFANSYIDEFKELFRDDSVNVNIESWDTRLLCAVILVIFHSDSASQGAKFEAVKCIFDQRIDLDNYLQSASLDFNTFETKWNTLHDAIIELIKDIDEKSSYDCKRMIHSCKAGSISISSELMKTLKETDDIYTHLTIALQNKTDPEHKNQGPNDKKELDKRQYGNSKFTKTLHDKYVYIDDSAILTCTLNSFEEQVTWRHNYEQIEESETLKIVKDGYSHWLAISCVKLEDAGLYTCASCNASTRANLRVLDKSLMVTEELHVATEEANVKENMDIVLVCQLNMHTTNVTWRHNNNVIDSNRHHVALNDKIHTLTILKVQYEDEGEYSIDFGTTISRTEVILKASISVALRAQLTNDLYKNWHRSVLGLKFLKLGLEDVSRSISEKHHSELLAQLSCIGITCTRCTSEQLLPEHQQQNCPNKSKCICSKQRQKRKYCPNGGFCSNFYDNVMFDHRFFEPLLANTDIQTWANDIWSVAKCYISISGYHDKSTEKEIDCAGLLSLFINNTFFEKRLNLMEVNGETDVFKKARDARNEILHNANYELSEGQLYKFLDLFIGVLEVKDLEGMDPLSNYLGTEEASGKLKELRNNTIDTTIAGDFQKQIQELKEHAMTEIAQTAKEAAKQNELKMHHLEERLNENEKELQLLRNLRSSQTQRKEKTDSQDVFKIDFHLQVIEQTGETSTQGNLRIFQSMAYSSLKTNTHQCTPPTDDSVQRLLEYIKDLENCRITDISNATTTVIVRINCYTCEAIETALKMLNGNEFQKEIIELRKCLEIHEHLKICDVIASCSSGSLDIARQKLFKPAQIKDFTCKKHSLECTWYCSDHDKFFCSTCKNVDHRRCIGLKQVVSGRSYKEQKQSIILKREINPFEVRINNRLINKSDNDVKDCDTTSLRLLPNGEYLLVDRLNKRIKKLDRTYNIVSHCDIPYTPFDVCYIGNDRAAVSLRFDGIQFVNVSGKMKIEHQVKLDHTCISLAFHGETLYVADMNTIYCYNKDCEDKHILYKYPFNDNDPIILYSHIAVSDDGDRIYIANGHKGFFTIDKEGNYLSSLTDDVAGHIMDVCVVGDGTVLVSDKSGRVYQIDYRGEDVLGNVISSAPDDLHTLKILCFDRQHCRLLASRDFTNFISVFKLKYYNTY